MRHVDGHPDLIRIPMPLFHGNTAYLRTQDWAGNPDTNAQAGVVAGRGSDSVKNASSG